MGILIRSRATLERGLFKTRKGILINADVNGGLNILRKVIGNGFIQNQKNMDCWLYPKRWFAYEHIKKKKPCKKGNGLREQARPKADTCVDDAIQIPVGRNEW